MRIEVLDCTFKPRWKYVPTRQVLKKQQSPPPLLKNTQLRFNLQVLYDQPVATEGRKKTGLRIRPI